MNNGIFLLLGSNLGQPLANLRDASKKIERDAGKIWMRSSVYKSAAWGVPEQPDFYNQVLQIQSEHPPEILLQKLLHIEKAMGRLRLEKWGPRLIDIDILFYGQETRNTPSLQIPHPGIPERKFTLIPLVEIAGNWQHPVSKKSMSALLEQCTDTLRVEKVAWDYEL
jgi:2-amino-4-hydroxy-6-hydroxymethyldihydropteridine diphosphokinase